MSYRLCPIEVPSPIWRGPPRTASGAQILAIGDLHGCGRLLIAMMEAFLEVCRDQLPPSHQRQIVLLGDLIDRGPNSLEILRALHELREIPGVVVLKGNHEALLIDSVDCRFGARDAWLKYGGDATVQTLELPRLEAPDDEFLYANRLSELIGEPIIDWLRGLPASFVSGDYFFCHAGVKPGVPLALQNEEDLMWIRSAFLNSKRFHGKVVVHGHHIEETILVKSNRIGVDTGAYESGMLTGLIVQDDKAWSLEVTSA